MPERQYLNLFIEADFSDTFFSGKTYLPIKNSYLLRFSDNKAEMLAVFLSIFLSIELCFTQVCY